MRIKGTGQRYKKCWNQLRLYEPGTHCAVCSTAPSSGGQVRRRSAGKRHSGSGDFQPHRVPYVQGRRVELAHAHGFPTAVNPYQGSGVVTEVVGVEHLTQVLFPGWHHH